MFLIACNKFPAGHAILIFYRSHWDASHSKMTEWGQAERVGLVQPGEEKAAGRPDCSLSVLKGSL